MAKKAVYRAQDGKIELRPYSDDILFDTDEIISALAGLWFQVSTVLGTAKSYFIPVPAAGICTEIRTVINGALATADETVVGKNNAGATMTNGTVTITQIGSAAKDVDSAAPTANNVFAEGEVMEIAVGGENTNAVECQVLARYVFS